jgi:lipopolysaccharide transport system permease protein
MSIEPIILEAGRGSRQYWRDLWSYRELLVFLAWRDVTVRYKQTLVGVAWAVVRPVSMALVFTVVFNKVANLQSDLVPYPLLVLSGMLPWQLFASALSESSNSLVMNSNMVSKVYFPRLIVPMSALAVSLIDFMVCLPILGGLMLYDGIVPTWRLLFLPLFVLLALAAALGGGLWLAALNVRYRDVRHVIPFLVQFGVYLSPVGFNTSKVPEEWRWLFLLNPMAGVIDGVRWSLFGPYLHSPFREIGFELSLFLVAAMLVGGLWYFRKTERTFADVI